MEVEYTLSVQDYLAFTRYQLGRSKRGSRLPAIASLAVVIIALSSIVAFSSRPGSQSVFGTFLAVLILALAYVILFSPIRLARKIASDAAKKGIGAVKVIISPESFSSISGEGGEILNWRLVERFVELDHHLLICTSANGYIIPRGAFESDTSFQTFVKTAKDYWRDARGSSSSLLRQ